MRESRDVQIVEQQQKRERELPKDFRTLSKSEYSRMRAQLERNAGRVNRGILQFINELDQIWFPENRPVGLLAKFLSRKIRDEGYRILRESRLTPDRARYINALLALHDCGIVRDDSDALGKPGARTGEGIFVDRKRIEHHIEAFLALEGNRRAHRQLETADEEKAARLLERITVQESDTSFAAFKEEFADRSTFVEMIGNRLWADVSKLPVTEKELSEALEQLYDRRQADLEYALRAAEGTPREEELAALTDAAIELNDIERVIRWSEWALQGMREAPDLSVDPQETRRGADTLIADLESAQERLRDVAKRMPREASHPHPETILKNLQNSMRELSERAATCTTAVQAALRSGRMASAPPLERERLAGAMEQTEDIEAPSEADMERIIVEMEREQTALSKERLELPARIRDHIRAFREAHTIEERRSAFGALHAFIVRE